jgi:hypothetical protein
MDHGGYAKQKENNMIGEIAQVFTVHHINADQHVQPNAPAAGTGKVGDRFYNKLNRRWYLKTNSTTWVML